MVIFSENDLMNHDLWEKLLDVGLSGWIWLLLNHLCSFAPLKLHEDNRNSEYIPISEGMVQGYISRPLLFILFIDNFSMKDG